MRPKWMGEPRLVTKIAKALALIVVVSLVIFPFWSIVATSLASPEEVIANGGWVVWPEHPTLRIYEALFQEGVVTRALWVSLGVTVFGTALSLACTIFLAYALSRPQIIGGRPILLLVLFTFLFPPGMIPSYLVVTTVGIHDQYSALILPFVVNVFNLVVMRGFFQGLPGELLEAARMDGAGEWRILTRVVLPLSKSVVAVVGLFYGVAYWNRWFEALIYLNDSQKWPIGTVLRQYVNAGSGGEAGGEGGVFAPQSMQMAVVVIATIPIVIVYPFLQRYFVRGVLTGAVKA
ncbi:MAG TPA: carbohydrate ABC transporter permease [Candidatus Limnocylindrales bacterium]